MSFSRRKFLVASAVAPLLSSCATNLSKFSREPVIDLATKLGVCVASYTTLTAGKANTPVLVSGCSTNRAIHPNPVFQAASLTKPVTAYAALKLVRDGRLDLYAPVSHYLPNGYTHRQNPFGSTSGSQFDVVPANVLARIPVATLLNHSSGLPNWTSGSLVPEFAPGERWQYSGEGYMLLQHVISTVSGQDIESFIAKTVFEPLDMQHSRLRLTEDIRPQLVRGTTWFGRASQFDFQAPNAAASLYTTAQDYGKFLSAVLADSVLLSLTVSRPISVDEQLGLAWGYGWGIEHTANDHYLWQWGNNTGVRSFVMISLVSKNGFVLLTNSEDGMPLVAPLARATVPDEHGVFRFYMLG